MDHGMTLTGQAGKAKTDILVNQVVCQRSHELLPDGDLQYHCP
jgi:hypothetical protein